MEEILARIRQPLGAVMQYGVAVPAINVPVVDAHAIDVPVVDVHVVDAPAIDVPVVDVPNK